VRDSRLWIRYLNLASAAEMLKAAILALYGYRAVGSVIKRGSRPDKMLVSCRAILTAVRD